MRRTLLPSRPDRASFRRASTLPERRFRSGAQASVEIPLFLALVACAGGDPPADGVTVRDSAGVRVVENHTPEWAGQDGWRLGDAPVVEVGGGTEANQQLYQVTAALRLDDGRIVIANGGANQLKFFDADGRWLYDRGGEGSGPGEFQHITWMAPFGPDSLIVFDRRQRRWSVFDTAGSFGANATLDQGMLISPTGLLEDGAIVSPVPHALNPPAEGEIHRANFAAVRIGRSDQTFDTVLTLRGVESYRHGRFPTPIPFARSTRLAARGSVIYTADSERYEIRKHDAHGALLARFSRPYEPRPVREQDVSTYKEQQLADLPQTMLEVMGPALEAAPGPPAMPALEELVVDAVGNLWVQDYQSPLDSGPADWSVFDADGRWLGEIETPAEFRLLDVGDDYILGVQRDALDVEHVVLYDLSKP